MTGTPSGTGKYVIEYDNHRYEDWLRKRRLRLEQVRKQSNDLAKALREKTLMEKKSKEEEYVKVKKVELDYWKATMLEELERKYLSAVEDFGRAHELAADENTLGNILEVKNKINHLKALERGEAAKQEEEKRRKLDIEKKLAPICRKKNTRKIEDLRSALVCSVQKNLMYNENSGDKEPQNFLDEDLYENEVKKKVSIVRKNLLRHSGDGEKVNYRAAPGKQILKKKISTHEKRRKDGSKEKKIVSAMRNHKRFSAGHKRRENNWENDADSIKALEEEIPVPRDTVWINLNELRSSSGKESESKRSSSSKTKESSNSSSGKREPSVTFYDQVSRSYTKSYREYPNLVEKVDFKREPHAFELARIEEEEELEEIKKKESNDKIRQERGKEALYKEKIKREYDKLLSKLGELSSKEKLLKTEQKIPPGILHMNDERISEKSKTRQKHMESKFEQIFYDSTFKCPHYESQTSPKVVYCQYEAGDIPEQTPTYLSFSPSNLKTNSPVSVSSQASPREKKSRKKRKVKKKSKKKLLSDIEKVLKRGKELRKTVSVQQTFENSDWDETPQEEVFSFSENVSSTGDYTQTIQPVMRVKCKMREKSECTVESQDREAQTDEIKTNEKCEGVELGPLEIDTRLENESLPVSTSTSYKSPPSVIHSCKLHQFLAYLESVSDMEGKNLRESSPRFRKKVKQVLKGMLLKKAGELKKQEPVRNPTLEYYILKLLSMSREHIADLSVSSDNQSTTTLSDLETKNGDLDEICNMETENSVKSGAKGEELIREMRLKRAADWEEKIKLWKAILEKNIKEPYHPSSEGEDGPVYSNPTALSVPDDNKTNPNVEKNKKEFIEEVKSHLRESEEKSGNPEEKSKYEIISQKCSERILELSNLLSKVRMDKEKLLSSTSGSTLSVKNSEREFCRDEDVFFRKVEPFVFHEFPYSTCKTKSVEESISNKAVVDSNSPRNSTISSEPLPDVENELLKREIITSPFRWAEGNHTIDLPSINHNSKRKPSIESVIGNFRKEMSKIKPFSLTSADNYLVSKSQELKNSDYISKKGNERLSTEFRYTEESSVDSINNALTSLGLNWAKTFLKKNEKSRAISSSSYSEGSKSSEDEEK